MSGVPHPFTVEVQIDGDRLAGCGGQPVSLLAGSWEVEQLDGGGLLAGSRITLEVSAEDRRVSGLASCNRFTAGFELGGEGLTVAGPASTRMACAPEVMEQEERFLHLLAGARAFDLDSGGKLILSGPAGRLTARRAPAP